MADLVKIWSFEHDAWWRPNSCGYTTVEADAGLYERKVAEEIVSQANHGGELNEEIVEIGNSPSKRRTAAPNSLLVEKVAKAIERELGVIGPYRLAAQAALDACEAEEAVDLLRSFVQHCPEPHLISMGFDSPPEHATESDHQLAYTLHLARALLARLEAKP